MDEPARLTIGQRLEEDPVDDCVDGRAGRDADDKRQHDDTPEPGVATKLPERESDIGREVV
jgi:hypothetical protein